MIYLFTSAVDAKKLCKFIHEGCVWVFDNKRGTAIHQAKYKPNGNTKTPLLLKRYWSMKLKISQ